jgi:hypothetical protein
MVYEICGCFKSCVAKSKWNTGSSKKRKTSFNYVAKFSFNGSHLMMSVRTT